MAKSKCGTCRYRQPIGAHMCCNYIGVTGHMRGCPAEKCTRYEKGSKLPPIAEEKIWMDYRENFFKL